MHFRTHSHEFEKAFFSNFGREGVLPVVQSADHHGQVGQVNKGSNPERVDKLAGSELANTGWTVVFLAHAESSDLSNSGPSVRYSYEGSIV